MVRRGKKRRSSPVWDHIVPAIRILSLTAATLATTGALAASARPAAPAGCGASSYSYAGVLGTSPAYGVGAKLSSVRRPTVSDGHVAGWVGVGGRSMGPNAADVWLQVGISALVGGATALYYEVALPNAAPRYVMLKGHLPVGKTFDVAVLEAHAHPGSWRVWVDGTAMTSMIYLAGSESRWRPTITAESWNGEHAGTCNRYAFRFGSVRIATKPGGAWRPLAAADVLSDPGYRLERHGDSLVAAGGFTPS